MRAAVVISAGSRLETVRRFKDPLMLSVFGGLAVGFGAGVFAGAFAGGEAPGGGGGEGAEFRRGDVMGGEEAADEDGFVGQQGGKLREVLVAGAGHGAGVEGDGGGVSEVAGAAKCAPQGVIDFEDEAVHFDAGECLATVQSSVRWRPFRTEDCADHGDCADHFLLCGQRGGTTRRRSWGKGLP